MVFRICRHFYRILSSYSKFHLSNYLSINNFVNVLRNHKYNFESVRIPSVFLFSAAMIHLKDDMVYYSKINDLNNLKKVFTADSVNNRHKLGWSMLMIAVANGNIDCAKFLLKEGAYVNEGDNYSGTMEMSRNLKINASDVDYIRKNEFSPLFNTKANCQGCTPLHYAVLLDNYEMVLLLLNNNADPTLENGKGFTPIQYSKSDQIKELLMSRQEEFLKNKKQRELEERRKFPIEHRLKKELVGQEAAINIVSATIRRKENGWTDEEHPLVFLFLGSSGVGKTEMAKQIAKYLHKDDLKKGFIRIDMSEYQERHEVAKFIGSPPGYIDHEKGGQLTKSLTQCPHALVLFDEVEKAHPDVLTILLQLFDEGRLTDGQGKTIECKKAIFVMTSNVASEQIAEHAQQLRDANKTDLNLGVEIGREFKEKIMRPILKKHFLRDEFLGRINEMVYFLPFSESELSRLVTLEMELWKTKAAQRHNIELSWDNGIVDYLADGYNKYYGARSIKYEVERKVVNELASAHEQGLFTNGNKIHLVLTKTFAKAELSNVDQRHVTDPPSIKMIITDHKTNTRKHFILGGRRNLWAD